jgi:hypothetical protein
MIPIGDGENPSTATSSDEEIYDPSTERDESTMREMASYQYLE